MAGLIQLLLESLLIQVEISPGLLVEDAEILVAGPIGLLPMQPFDKSIEVMDVTALHWS